MRLHKTLIFILIALLFPISSVRAEYDYVDISNPFLRKIPIGIPLFAAKSKNPREAKIAKNCTELISETLSFTSYFKIIDPKAFIAPSGKTGLSTINFANWTGIGAELLVTGIVLISDNNASIELRLFDTLKKSLLIGKRYVCKLEDQRREILRFCSLIIEEITGKPSFFNSKVAFVSTTSGNKEIYFCDFDGRNPKKITNSKAITLSPAWSSDAKYLAYTSYKKGKPDLFIRNLASNNEIMIAKKGINITPAWVPDKFALAATFSFSGDQDIYMLTGAGKIIKNLTNKWGIDVSPTFSPDGKRMAFVSRRSGTPQIYIKDLKSNRDSRITFYGQYNTTPSWSPTGNKIAYSSFENGQFNICVISDTADNLVQLTDTGDNESPTWSPDGSLIAFSSNREGVCRIYVMTAFGTDQRRLLALSGEQTNPKWSPNIVD